MIKAVLSDFDGTLVNKTKIYDPQIIPLIQQIKERNIYFSLATGRSYFGLISKVIKEINPSHLHIAYGGGVIINSQTGEMPLYRPVSDLSVKKIITYLHKHNVHFSMESKENAHRLEVFEVPTYMGDITIQMFSLDTPPSGILKILVHSSVNSISEEQLETYRKELFKECKDIEFTRFVHYGKYGCDITSENSTKHTAVLEYAKMLGLKQTELVGIGDDYNDYPLFTACGYKIAMGNAPKELKEIADKIVNTSDEGGTVEALQHILSLSSDTNLT